MKEAAAREGFAKADAWGGLEQTLRNYDRNLVPIRIEIHHRSRAAAETIH